MSKRCVVKNHRCYYQRTEYVGTIAFEYWSEDIKKAAVFSTKKAALAKAKAIGKCEVVELN